MDALQAIEAKYQALAARGDFPAMPALSYRAGKLHLGAGMNDLVRAAMYDAYMKIVECIQTPHSMPSLTRWDVVGPVCESGDWLGVDRALHPVAGEYLAVLSAGAYGMSMASNYNSRPRPAEVLVEGSNAMLIRRRETINDLLRHEIQLP